MDFFVLRIKRLRTDNCALSCVEIQGVVKEFVIEKNKILNLFMPISYRK
jgi:hypothetical protein